MNTITFTVTLTKEQAFGLADLLGRTSLEEMERCTGKERMNECIDGVCKTLTAINDQLEIAAMKAIEKARK